MPGKITFGEIRPSGIRGLRRDRRFCCRPDRRCKDATAVDRERSAKPTLQRSPLRGLHKSLLHVLTSHDWRRRRFDGWIAASERAGLQRVHSVHCSNRLRNSRCSRQRVNLPRHPAASGPSWRRASARHCSGYRDPDRWRSPRTAPTPRTSERSTSGMPQQVFSSSSLFSWVSLRPTASVIAEHGSPLVFSWPVVPQGQPRFRAWAVCVFRGD
jgi:hypothetical protein